jgi:predicted GNAT family N-acyltransferase
MRSSTDDGGFSIRRADWATDRTALRRIRRLVFVDGQGVPEELEWDGKDGQATHLLAADGDGRPIGTARVLPTGQIGRMAVLNEWRGRGVGRALLREALRAAAEGGHGPPFLHAQSAALGFYEGLGLVAEGEEFTEAGMAHRRMVLAAPTGSAGSALPRRTRADAAGDDGD